MHCSMRMKSEFMCEVQIATCSGRYSMCTVTDLKKSSQLYDSDSHLQALAFAEPRIGLKVPTGH